MITLLNEIKQVSSKYQFTSLDRSILAAENMLHEKFIDIVILGQFKAGKSSFFNSFIGKKVLPTGVIPVTSIITRLQYGSEEKAFILFEDKKSIAVQVNEIGEYITEIKNPVNIKKVELVDIILPCLKQFEGIRFVDTPGIGSIFQHNTETTENWFSEIGIAFVTISAERPLGENELALISGISKHCPKVVILLTKVDLFSDAQVAEIRDYIDAQLKKEFSTSFSIFNYSVIKNFNEYKQVVLNEVIQPVLSDLKNEHEKIARHKINALAESCLNYLDIAFMSSLKSDEEKEHLKKKIFDEKLNSRFIRQELQLIATNSKSQTRDLVYHGLRKYEPGLITQLQSRFYAEYVSWKGNLNRLSRKYQDWLKNSLSSELKEISLKEQEEYNNIIKGVNDHFGFFTKSFRARLSENIYNLLGIRLAVGEWSPEIKPLKKIDVSVYRAFDTPIDTLWFLFPMFLFKRIFGKYFLKQIANEVEKNVHRITSDINEIINREIDAGMDQTLKYILNEIETIEKVLSGKQSRSDEYQKTADLLRQKLIDFRLL